VNFEFAVGELEFTPTIGNCYASVDNTICTVTTGTSGYDYISFTLIKDGGSTVTDPVINAAALLSFTFWSTAGIDPEDYDCVDAHIYTEYDFNLHDPITTTNVEIGNCDSIEVNFTAGGYTA
jgi:hypothetical protein